MQAALYRPLKPLSDFVDCLWAWDRYPAPATRERALPAGTLDLIINLERDRRCFYDQTEQSQLTYSGSVMCGAQSRYLVIETSPVTSVVGVHFKPGGAFPFLGEALSALEGTQVDLDALWGPQQVRNLRERLLEASSNQARFHLLETWLITRARHPLEHHPAVAEALRAFEEPTLRSVAEVCARTGYSAKRLIAVLRAQVGLTPKAYWRVRRFQAALRRLDSDYTTRGAELALELGYYDQAHFVREFHGFTGLSPSRYLAHEIERPNHVPLRG